MAAAVVLVAAGIGLPLGRDWMAGQEPTSSPRDEPQEDSAAPTVAQSRPTLPAVAVTPPPVEVEAPAPAPPVRQPKPAARQEPVAVPSPAPAALVVDAPAPEPLASPLPAPEPVAAPVGPFFEMRQVNEAPQVTSRVEPQVPDGLQGPVNEIVIVRVLVSQTGHPSLVSVLRGSRVGQTLDDAVITAVKQWMFSPARKRGEAVSCWYNVGVPVTGGE